MKKIKKIATGGIVGSLLFVSSGSVGAQTIIPAAPSSQRNSSTNIESEYTTENDFQQDIQIDNIGIQADEDLESYSRDVLLDQGFNPSQIQKLYKHRNIDGE